MKELLAVPAQDRENRRSAALRAQEARMLGLMAIEEGGDPAVIESHLRTAISESRAWQCPVTVARCQADLGSWLTRQGRAEQAAPLLVEARATFDRLGAVAWSQQLDAPLAGVPAL